MIILKVVWFLFQVNISIFKLLPIVEIVFKCYSDTYCLMQGSCFICSDF